MAGRRRRRIQAILRRYADLADHPGDAFPLLDGVAARAEEFYSPDDLEEMQGIADGAGVSPEAVVAHNLRVFSDAAAGCTHFALTARANPGVGMLHAANEDLPLGLSLRDCLVRNVQGAVRAAEFRTSSSARPAWPAGTMASTRREWR